MILSDSEILKQLDNGGITIDPFKRENLGPNSVDLRLGNTLKTYTEEEFALRRDDENFPKYANLKVRRGNFSVSETLYGTLPLDPKKDNPTEEVTMTDNGYVLYPGEVYLSNCVERIGAKVGICAQIAAKSSLGRLGLDIIIGPAGFTDTGFEGSMVLELRATRPIVVYPGMNICQIVFYVVHGEVLVPYDKKPGSKYAGQVGVQQSKYHENFKTPSASWDAEKQTATYRFPPTGIDSIPK